MIDYERNSVIDYERNRVIDYERNRVIDYERTMESCQLADLKYAIFSSSGCKTKKLPRSKLFLSMVFKHGLLEGSTSEQM